MSGDKQATLKFDESQREAEIVWAFHSGGLSKEDYEKLKGQILENAAGIPFRVSDFVETLLSWKMIKWSNNRLVITN